MKKFFLTILHYLGWPFVGIAFLINILLLNGKVKRYINEGENYRAVDRYKVIYGICKKFLYLKNVKVQSKGFNNIPHKPVLFIVNHKSAIDPVVLVKILFEQEGLPYFSFVSKVENKQSKIVSRAMQLIDTIYIDRDNLRQQFEAYEEQIKAINSTKSIVIFPEGTRIYEHGIKDMKSAALKVSYKTYIPIVPIVIYGSSGLADSNKQYIDKHRTVYAQALEPLNPTSFVTTKQEFVCEKIQQSMNEKYLHIKKLVDEKKEVFPKE